MKKYLFLIIALSANCVFAQRVPTDAVTLPVTVTGTFNINSSFIDIQHAGSQSFWAVSTGSINRHYSTYPLGDIRIEKRDKAGFGVQSALSLNGDGAIYNIESDTGGNLYIIGFFRDSLSFGSGNTLYAPATNRYFLMKVDTNMQIAWVNDSIIGEHVTVTPDGNTVYVRGDLGGFGGDVTFYRLNASGQVVQSKEFTGIGYIDHFKAGAGGELYFAGGCIDEFAQLDTVDASHNFSYTMYYGKMDASLTTEWIKIMDDFTCESPFLDIDSLGNILFYGPLNKSITLDGFQAQPSPSSFSDFLFTSTTPAGQVNFVADAPPGNHRVAVSYSRGIATRGNKAAVLLSQSFIDTISWGNGLQTFSAYSGAPVVLEYNISGGNLLTANSFPTASREKAKTILYLSGGDILVTGIMGGSYLYTSTDTIPGSTRHLYIERWEVPSPVISNREGDPAKFTVYPNPSAGVFKFSQPVSGRVYNVAGQEVTSLNEQQYTDLSGQQPGLYLLRTNTGHCIKLVKWHTGQD